MGLLQELIKFEKSQSRGKKGDAPKKGKKGGKKRHAKAGRPKAKVRKIRRTSVREREGVRTGRCRACQARVGVLKTRGGVLVKKHRVDGKLCPGSNKPAVGAAPAGRPSFQRTAKGTKKIRRTTKGKITLSRSTRGAIDSVKKMTDEMVKDVKKHRDMIIDQVRMISASARPTKVMKSKPLYTEEETEFFGE